MELSTLHLYSFRYLGVVLILVENLVGTGAALAAGKIESAGTTVEAAELAGNEAETGEEWLIQSDHQWRMIQ